MINEIVSKLGIALAQPINEECQVVYILTEIGKLLEGLGKKKDFPVLWMYRSWALHPNIDVTTPLDTLLDKIEEAVRKEENRPFVMLEFADFEHFREDITKFLKSKNIKNNFGQHDYWIPFRTNLLKIIKDCPLKPSRREITEIYFKDSNEKEVNFIIRFRNHLPVNAGFIFN